MLLNTSYNSYYEKIGNETKNIDDEIPFEIPNSWMWIRVDNYAKNVTDFVASGSFKSLRENVKYYDEPNYAILVRTCDFKTNFSKSLVYTDEHGYTFLSNSNLFGGEIILSNIGASIGKVFIVPNLNKKMTLAPNSIMVKLFFANLNNYFYYLFMSPYGQKILFDISGSSAQAKFNKTDFKQLLIPIPPLKEQIRIKEMIDIIVSLLKRINNDCSNLEVLIDKIKSKILDEIFGENSSYKSYYKNKMLNDISIITMGQSPNGENILLTKRDNSLEFHQGKLAFDKMFINKSNKYAINYNKVAKKNSILICVRAPVGDINITDRDIAIGRGLCAIKPLPNVELKYLFYYLLFMNKYFKSKSSGSTFQAITIDTLKNCKILLPEIAIQRQIINRIESFYYFTDLISS